jgi:GT2 family glycosyltransferase
VRRADITVAVATMNRPAALARCLEAVLEAERRPSEIVVVDQSADDETQSVIDRMPAGDGIPITYLRQARLGLAASRNAAIAASTRPYIAFTDDDCVPGPQWLAAIAAAFEDANAQAVTGRILPLGPHRPGTLAVSSRPNCLRMRFQGRTLPWAVGSGANISVAREWLDRIGGFNTRLGAGSEGRSAEDVDLLYRLLLAGATVQYEPDAVMFHERKDEAVWFATRSSYGYGMGAFCGMWLRSPDSYAGWMLARWCAERTMSLVRACAKGRGHRVAGELLMLKAAAAGVAYGWRCEGSRVRWFEQRSANQRTTCELAQPEASR